MKIHISKKIVDSVFKVEITTFANEIEKKYFTQFGEPYINIAYLENFRDLKKVYTDSPFIIIAETSEAAVANMNSIISDISNKMDDLKANDNDFEIDSVYEI
jgi:hypothetical protein